MKTVSRNFSAMLLIFAMASPALAEKFDTFFPGQLDQIEPSYRAGLEALDFKQGKIQIVGGEASLDVPDGFYYLDAKDGRYVLESLWGNPPDSDTLGMIFPRDKSPVDNTWGIVITFDAMGYVSDSDAANTDYDALMKGMIEDTVAANPERIKQGFGSVELKGWAEKPHYDATERKLYWAKLLHFDGDSADTVNYNIRALGRKGVLVVNFIASADQLPQINAASPAVLKMISFNEGSRYSDYLPNVDTVAAVGIGGLIAGKVAAKAGLIVLMLAFLKKGAILILLPLIWLKNKIFGPKKES